MIFKNKNLQDEKVLKVSLQALLEMNRAFAVLTTHLEKLLPFTSLF
jgi:hypothetical protein